MFEEIIGNSKIKEELEKSIDSKKTSHSYLFIGTKGIGKKLIAKEFSKVLLCLNEQKCCNNCKSCIEFNTNNNPDYYEIEPIGTSIKIDEIRQMQNKMSEKPIISSKKVYVINDSDKMTKEAQNCLLKTLEEPPQYVTIILIGSNENAFLSTIKSRCTIIHFQDLKQEEIKKYLESKQINIKNEIILKASGGSIGKALELKEKQEKYEEIYNIITNIKNMDIIDLIKKSKIIYESKEEIIDILEYINIIILELSKKEYQYIKCIEIVENTKKRLKSNSNYDMSIDNMFFKIKEELN